MPYSIHNDTGIELRYFTGGDGGGTAQPLAPGASADLTTVSSAAASGGDGDGAARSVSIQLKGGWHAVHNIPLDLVATRSVRLTPAVGGVTTRVVHRVVLAGAAKVLVLTSPLCVVNGTSVAYEIAVASPRLPDAPMVELEVAAGESAALPVHMAADAVIRVRPAGGFRWSSEITVASMAVGERALVTARHGRSVETQAMIVGILKSEPGPWCC
jgi:hypothetical protein